MNEKYDRKSHNAGFTLVELIVIIAIMGVVVGGASLGVGLIFTKDASQCATRLNDAIYSTRMKAMSKAGVYELVIDNASGVNTAEVLCDSASFDHIYLDDSDTSLKTNITCKYITDSGAESAVDLPVKLSFDKAKGSIKIDDPSITTDGIICFDIDARRGSNNSSVKIVTSTGKHTIGDF